MNASIGGYNNPAAEWVIAAFMLIFGINFNLYFFILIGRLREFLKSEELRVYLLLVFISTALISANTLSLSASFGDCVRDAFFQVTSIASTTGYATLDYDALWPTLSKAILLLLTVTGAMAGSTAGGMKISRVIILFKSAFREIRHVLRPRSVNLTRLDGEVLREETVHATLGYLTVYLLLLVFGTVLLSFDPFGSLDTNFTATLTCLSNVGPGLGAVGPAGNFAGFSVLSKLLLSFLMLVGRLEIFPMLILFSPTTWKRR
jgi:trk system potassium uptake protein TrkH